MKKICIVASKYYEDIINMLVSGVNDVLNNHKKKVNPHKYTLRTRAYVYCEPNDKLSI